MTFQRGSVCAVGGGRSDPECDVRSDELPSNDLEIGHGHDCSECHSTLFVGGSIDSAWTEPTDDRSLALEAFADAVEFFHDHIYRPIDDHHSEHAVRPDKGREYSECVRDWDAETVDSKQFGLSLADETALLDYLMG